MIPEKIEAQTERMADKENDMIRRTELAEEAFDGGEGLLRSEECVRAGGISVSRIEVKSRAAAARLGRPCGNYVTLTVPPISEARLKVLGAIGDALAEEIKLTARSLCGGMPRSVFVAGIGNAKMTADALGPETVSRLTPTRHIAQALGADGGFCRLCAVAAGVEAQTGISTEELFSSLIRRVEPDLVIAVDALAASSISRLGKTVQLCDAGTAVGGGVGARRGTLSRDTVGVHVVSLGVPTVVRFAPSRRSTHEDGDLLLTVQDCDALTRKAAMVISRAISDAFFRKA